MIKPEPFDPVATVIALARSNPSYWTDFGADEGSGYRCSLCDAHAAAGDPGRDAAHHQEACIWRRAVEWLTLVVETTKLSRRQADALDSAFHLHEVLDGTSLNPGRIHRAPVLRSLEALGFMQKRDAVLVDGNGFAVEPERWVVSYKLTALGLALAEHRKKLARAAAAA